MKYFYDLEFFEDGTTIEHISIGIVSEDGREYYAVNEEVGRDMHGVDKLYKAICNQEWLMANVVPYLPLHRDSKGKQLLRPKSNEQRPWFSLDHEHMAVLPLHVIAKQVKAFLYNCPDDDPIQLWAWYGAYDHVALMQLWGRMMHRPDRLPMWTHDLNQHAEHLGLTPDQLETAVPQPSAQHHALHDALRARDMWHYLESIR